MADRDPDRRLDAPPAGMDGTGKDDSDETQPIRLIVVDPKPGEKGLDSGAAVAEPSIAHTLDYDGSRPAFVPPRELGKLGDYDLLSELGRGGMGIVYKARQRSLNRLVALKTVLSRTAATDVDVQRFRNEAKAAANLRHPGIVAIHEVGEVGGCHYYSMELIDGKDLSNLVREHSLPAKQAAEFMIQLAEAVDYAHSQGVLHRDLKPSNVLIDEFGKLKISDFGLAKRVQSESQLTAAGDVVGTPSYMPPEQAMPTRMPVGPYSDIYALGAILYQLLTCRPPFRAENPLETIRQLVHDEPVAPRVLNPRIPLDLETICLKCLEKDPERRYSSGKLLADELQRFLAGEPILATPINRAQRLWRMCLRHPIEAALISGVVVSILFGLAGVAWQWQRADRNFKRADRNFRMLNQASAEVLEIVEDWVTRVPMRADTQQAKLEGVLKSYEQFLNEEPAHTAAREKLAETHYRVADIRRRLRQLDLAAHHYRLAIEQYQYLARELPGNSEWRQRIADVMASLGDTLRSADQFDEALQQLNDSIQMQEQLFATDSSPKLWGRLARARYNRGLLLTQTGNGSAHADFDRAIRLLEEASLAEPANAEFRQGLARSHVNLGILLRGNGKTAEALEHYSEGIRLLSALLQESPSVHEYSEELAQAHMNRSNLLLVNHNKSPGLASDPLDEARKSYEESIRLLSGLVREFPYVPDYRIELANSLNGLGALHQVAKRPEEARPLLERARNEFDQLIVDGGESAEVRTRLAMTLGNLAKLVPRENIEEHIRLLRKAIESQQLASQLNPSATVIVDRLQQHRLVLVRALLLSGEHGAAAAEADALARLALNRPRDARLAAELLIRGIDVSQKDSRLGEDEREVVADEYARRAVQALEIASRSEPASNRSLLDDPKFAILRDRPDFQALRDSER